MRRCVVNVSTGEYVRGGRRLRQNVNVDFIGWFNELPPSSPTHQHTPYAFKAWAIDAARSRGYTSIIWADASILPIADMEPLWRLIESRGYWLSRNGFRNSEWTAREALPLLGVTAEENDRIEHVVATTFGLDLRSKIGATFAGEYLRMAQNGAFCGPWTGGVGVQHRHDQTAASVIAHRLGMVLTDPPKYFAYRGGETAETVLLADGDY